MASDIFEASTVTTQHDSGSLLTTVARHPALGSVVGVQSISGVMVVSELPIARVGLAAMESA
jgi:hypothetical protein